MSDKQQGGSRETQKSQLLVAVAAGLLLALVALWQKCRAQERNKRTYRRMKISN